MMMKKLFVGLTLFSFFIAGCLKKNTNTCSYTASTVVAPATEVDSLQTLLTDSGYVATPSSTGFYYKITNSGSGPAITSLCSNVTVTYKGRFFNGHTFDSTGTGATAIFQPGQVIAGWQKGVPLISNGGDITLYIPPSLGYGSASQSDSQGNVIIPANSYLIFDIHVVNIQ